MGYDPRKCKKPEELLTEEEIDVAYALKEYTTDPVKTDIDDFVPVKVLYRIYRNYAAKYVNDPESPGIIGIRAFGAALRRVFPELDDYCPVSGKNEAKARRTYHGKREWGYIGMRGPESIRSYDYKGRPSHDPGE